MEFMDGFYCDPAMSAKNEQLKKHRESCAKAHAKRKNKHKHKK